MEVNNYLAFPTVISRTKSVVSEQEKDQWFDLYLKHSNSDGQSHDFVGFESVQTDELFRDLFMDRLKSGVDEYLRHLRIRQDKLDIQLTKCFFNVTDQMGINLHDHAENHISFTYYPHIADGKERNINFQYPHRAQPNEPYEHFFECHGNPNNKVDSFPISEGVLYIFPSNLLHNIEMRKGDSQSVVQPFKDKESLRNSRFCVAGDLLYTRKIGVKQYERVLSNPKLWRTV